jgi:hypothetical protein
MVIFSQNPVNAVLVFVEIIETGFKTDNEKNQQANRDAHRKSKDIDNGISLVSFEISEADSKVIF